MSYDLVPEWQVGDLLLTDYPYSVDRDSSVDIGEPEVFTEVVPSFLMDGDDERETRSGNRTYVLTVYVEGADLAEVATNEAALRSALRVKGLTLTHTPGDDFSPASVYEVLTARMRVVREDPHESHLIRKVVLTLTCSSFARSVDLVTVEALAVPASATTVTFDTCDSATGWTATYNGAPSTVDMAWAAGAVSVHDLLAPGPQTLTLTRTGAVDFTPTRYLVAEIGYNAAFGALAVTCVADGSRALTLLDQRLISPGRYLYTYDTGAVDATSLTFSSYTPADYADLKIFSLVRTDTPPSVTPRQSSRILIPGGTERTPAAIHVESADGVTANDLTLIHTTPEMGVGYSPDLRRWRVTGNTEVADGATFSGQIEQLAPNTVIADMPMSSIPKGGYLLCAALRSSATGTFNISWAVRSIVAGTEVGIRSGLAPAEFFTTTDWHFIPLGLATLPTVMSNDGQVRAQMSYTLPDATIVVDEWWLFRVDDDSALTAVFTAPAHLWLDSPSASTGPQPQVWIGDAADRSDARHPGGLLTGSGNHVLHAEGTAVFVATRGGDNPKVTSSHHKRWHSNAAE